MLQGIFGCGAAQILQRRKWIQSQILVASLWCDYVLLSEGAYIIIKAKMNREIPSLLSQTLSIAAPSLSHFQAILLRILFNAGCASFHLCKPGGTWHAWDHLGCIARHSFGKDIWWPWTQDSLLWVSADNATGIGPYQNSVIFIFHFRLALNVLDWFRCEK